ncbi:NmrA family NAD(P)-binding protein [Mumia sp. DW29H23]|uniref:NmrA family NAD(P)-binding protein n=1 Tax=Mumia sp. DW29H23 TaxID=3421241 RepID=UPI003D69A960
MRIAVTGASGNVGGHVASLLTEAGGHDVVGLSRRGPVHADYDDLASLRAALREVDTLVFVSSDGEAARMITQHANVVRAAADEGVAHVVYLSGLDADVASPFCYAYTNGTTEAMLAGSGCATSVVRASIFTEFFAGFLDRARESGTLRLPTGGARISLVSREDVGRCLAALALGPPTGRVHAVTGPVALDLEAIAAATERRWRTPVRPVDVPAAAFATELAERGEDPWWSYAYASMFASVREGRWDAVSDEVRLLTGRAPLPFGDVLPPRP